jgi:hypothetical protein
MRLDKEKAYVERLSRVDVTFWTIERNHPPVKFIMSFNPNNYPDRTDQQWIDYAYRVITATR